MENKTCSKTPIGIYIQYIYISHRMFPWWLVIHHHLRCRNIFRKTIFIRSLVNSHPFTNPLGGLRLDQPKSWIVIIHKLIINPPSFISSLLSPLFFHAWSPQWHSSNTQDIYIYKLYIVISNILMVEIHNDHNHKPTQGSQGCLARMNHHPAAGRVTDQQHQAQSCEAS